MLQVTLDASSLSAMVPGVKGNCEISIALSGASWQANTAIPREWKEDTMFAKKCLYPWKWERPGKIRLYWIQKEGNYHESKGFEDFDIKDIVSLPPDDITAAQTYYERILEPRIFAGPAAEPIIKEEIWMSYSGAQKAKTIEITDAPSSTTETGFFSGAIAQFAQKLPPLNEALSLAFFSLLKKEITVPGDTYAFAAFPFSESVNSRWMPGDAGMPERIRIPLTEDHVDITYQGLDGIKMKVYCPLTPFPKAQVAGAVEGPIELRDKPGNFLGHVHLRVNDVEDAIQSIIFESAPFFSCAGLFRSYLSGTVDQWKYQTGIDFSKYKKWVEQLEDFLWSVARDSSGYGFRKESDNEDMARRIARQYCDDVMGEVEQMDDRDEQVKYWAEYNKINNALHDKLEKTWDKAFENDLGSKKWRMFILRELVERNNETGYKLDADIISLLPQLELKLEAAAPEVINKAIEKWLENWEKFIAHLNDHALQNRILAIEWTMDPVKLNEAGIDVNKFKVPHDVNAKDRNVFWFENVFSKAGNALLVQQEAIAVKYKKTLLRSTGNATGLKPDLIAADCRSAIKEYVQERISNTNKTFFPLCTDPFVNPPTGLITAPAWTGLIAFVGSVAGGTDPIEKAMRSVIEKPFNIVPPLKIQVDKLESAASLEADDLADEIAGHLVLLRRSDGINTTQFTAPWRYLNLARINVAFKKDPPFQAELKGDYVVPAFIPEMAGDKASFLELSNEKLSLIAGHETFKDQASRTDESGEGGYIHYSFHQQYPAYALWYGYNYAFSGFIALNSGALPTVLRKDPAIVNLPSLEPSITAGTPETIYHHLRRVPVSKVRVNARRYVAAAPPGQREQNIILPPPGLLPLAFELTDWKSNLRASDKEGMKLQDDQSHYLMVRDPNGKNNQNEIVLKLRKPTTSFGNWYAWLGEEAKKPHIESRLPQITIAQKALELELENRDKQAHDPDFSGAGHLCDPAVENKLFIVADQLFPVVKSIGEFAIEMGAADRLADPESMLKIIIGNATAIKTDQQTGEKYIEVAEGTVIRVKIHGLVKKHYFDPTDKRKFHQWMSNISVEKGKEFDGCYLTHPVESWFEVAKKPAINKEILWKSLGIGQEKDNVYALINKTKDNYIEFAYSSRVEVRHQVWNWNGRLDESGEKLGHAADKPLDPVITDDGRTYTTNAPMEWEAWAFSDRPDFSALVYETNLLAARISANESDIKQKLFSDNRPNEEKALYYRFSLTAHSRYELLGKNFAASVDSAIIVDGVENKWRRYLRKCSKIDRLPKPSLRFAIPLTRSISECKDREEITSGKILVVLDDLWYSQGGLAEQLEVGIEVLSPPKKEERYLNAGNDPILSKTQLPRLAANGTHTGTEFYIDENGSDTPMAVFKPRGPIGFTFDFAAQTPRLKGCGFILSVPDIKSIVVTPAANEQIITNKLQPWSMMRIALRRVLRKEFCEQGVAIPSLFSEWTAKEWVQFLPSIDSFIPGSWRKNVLLKGAIDVKPDMQNDKLSIAGTVMPALDSDADNMMERFIVVTEKVYDMGSQPSERYIATYQVIKEDTELGFVRVPDEGAVAPVYSKNQEGYLRILTVRKSKFTATGSVWTRIFGESAEDGNRPDITVVQNDPTAALPLVSERIPFRISL